MPEGTYAFSGVELTETVNGLRRAESSWNSDRRTKPKMEHQVPRVGTLGCDLSGICESLSGDETRFQLCNSRISKRSRGGFGESQWRFSGITSASGERRFLTGNMNEYHKQACFLKKLVLLDDTPANRELCDRLKRVERCEKSTQCACRLVGLIALLGLAGLGYASVLMPEFFDNSTHFMIRLCSALGLGSTLCFATFLGVWCSYRIAANRLHDECRAVIANMLAARTSVLAVSAQDYDPVTRHPAIHRRTVVLSDVVDSKPNKVA